MHKVIEGWIHPSWPAPPNVRAFTTTRRGGFSKGRWSSLNLGDSCGDDPADVAANRSLVEAALPAPANWLRQVHGTSVLRLSERREANEQGDAEVSFLPGRVCAVLTADCLPVFFCNRRGDRVGLAHAGWRGLAGGILQAAVAALDEDPAELIAWLGPAIGPQSYEVGRELAASFAEEFPAGFSEHGDRFLMDLYTLARLKLAASGVPAVYGGEFCTYADPERFYSFRRDGVTGRMASVIWFDAIGQSQFAGA